MIEFTVTDEAGRERAALVTDYSYSRGYRAVTHLVPEECSPGEPARLEKFTVTWKTTGREFSDAEIIEFDSQIQAAIWGHVAEEEADLEAEAADDAYEGARERGV